MTRKQWFASLGMLVGASTLAYYLRPRPRRHSPLREEVASPVETAEIFSGESDWGDAGLGPNFQLQGGAHARARARINLRGSLIIEPLIAQRFNAYAMYARPREIGGLLRVVEDDDGNIRVIDLRIFPHLAASSGYFELDGAAVAQNNLDLARAGRKDEISQWCSLIHSHPGFEPFLSSTDCENVLRLAGGGRAHSLICSAADNCADNYYAWHYAQGGAFPMVVCDLAYETDPKLAGIDLLSATELKTIAAEVEAAFVDVGGYTRRKP